MSLSINIPKKLDKNGQVIIKYIINNILDNPALIINNDLNTEASNLNISINKAYQYPVPLLRLTPEESINYLSDNYYLEGSTNTICEILSENVRVFFDFEKIPVNNHSIIYKIINDFIKYCKINDLDFNDDDKIIITENKNSKHQGLSFHAYIPVMMNINELRKLQLLFVMKYQHYAPYIDNVVYHKNRFFRCPGQFEPKLNNTYYEYILQNDEVINKNSFHKFLKIGTITENEIIYNNYTKKDLKLCIKNSLIQNIYNLNHISLNENLFDNPIINKIIKDKYPHSYEYYLRAFSKNVDDTYRDYHDLIKTHVLKNGKNFREYFLNMDNVDLIINKDDYGNYIADIENKTTCESDFYHGVKCIDKYKYPQFYPSKTPNKLQQQYFEINKLINKNLIGVVLDEDKLNVPYTDDPDYKLKETEKETEEETEE